MVRILEECQQHFHTKCLYEVLGVEKSCKPAELRKAFYKKSLLYHPDRHDVAMKEEATARFQLLSAVYTLLADNDKRTIYDESGVVDDEDVFSDKSYDDWMKYWQMLFPKVTTKQIDEYAAKYKGSKEELNDLTRIYEQSEGDMDIILETLLFTSYEDEERIRTMLTNLIAEKKVKAYSLFVDEPKEKALKRTKRAEEEAKRFEKYQKKKAKTKSSDVGDFEALALQIRTKHKQSSEALLESLTAKYCNVPARKQKGAKKSKK